MCNYILLLVFLSASFFSLGMQGPHPIVEYTFACEGSPLWRPNTQELILQKRLIRKPARDPQDPSSFLKAHGPLVYTCIYNPTTGQEQLLDKGNELPLSMKCSSKGTYLAALTACPAQISTESILIPNARNLLTVWNLATRAIVFESLTRQLGFTISPCQKYIACCSEDDTKMVIRSLKDGLVVKTIDKTPLDGSMSCLKHLPSLLGAVAFSLDDKLVAFENYNTIQVINMDEPSVQPIVIEGYAPQFGTNNLLKVRSSSTITVYDTREKITGEFKTMFKTYASCQYNIFFDAYRRMTFDPGFQKTLVAPNAGICTYKIYDMGADKFPLEDEYIVAVSADFSLYAVLKEKVLQIKNVTTKKILHEYHWGRIWGEHIFFSPNNEYLFSEVNTRTAVWNFQKGAAIYEKKIKHHTMPYIPSVCSPDCTQLLIRSAPSHATIIDLKALTYKKT